MNRIYFVRHAEGQDNISRRFSTTWMDHPLTERGRLQARQTGDHLAGLQIDRLFCSPMKRTHETAGIIAERLNMGLSVLEELREVNVGDLEGKDFNDENWGVYHQVTSRWYAGDSQAGFPGGEDYVTLVARMRAGYRKILQDRNRCSSVIVGHGGMFLATLKEFIPGLEIDWLQDVEYYHCAITELELSTVNGEITGRILDWANTGHLSGEARSRLAAIPPRTSIRSP